jgi:hypothetical protein
MTSIEFRPEWDWGGDKSLLEGYVTWVACTSGSVKKQAGTILLVSHPRRVALSKSKCLIMYSRSLQDSCSLARPHRQAETFEMKISVAHFLLLTSHAKVLAVPQTTLSLITEQR